MARFLAENLNAALVLAGFVSLEAGLAVQWSGAVASMVGGSVLMVGGSWPYVVRTLRKRSS